MPSDEQPRAQLLLGDCIDRLQEFEPDSFDAVVCDPPYGLSKEPDIVEVMTHWIKGDDYVHRGGGFMGKNWDSFVPGPSVWKAVYRVLKPGGHLLSFAGTRTFDLMGISLRLGGFEIRDTIHWAYGSGFPKSLDVSKAIDKAAGAKRPVIGKNPLAKQQTGQQRTVALAGDRNPHTHLTGPATPEAEQWEGWGTALKPAHEPILLCRKPLSEKTVAKNVLKHSTGGINIDGTRIGYIDAADAEHAAVPQPLFGVKAHGKGTYNYRAGEGRNGVVHDVSKGRWPANFILSHSAYCKKNKCHLSCPVLELDQQTANIDGASRFFYTTKASRSERNAGVEKGNNHATVKPIKLMRYLVRLVTPPNGTVLDSHAGSGTTGVACVAEGFNFVGIEKEKDHFVIARQRIQHAFTEE
jgi:site-specific DNA-methyltransferase (adenine-specific)